MASINVHNAVKSNQNSEIARFIDYVRINISKNKRQDFVQPAQDFVRLATIHQSA